MSQYGYGQQSGGYGQSNPYDQRANTGYGNSYGNNPYDDRTNTRSQQNYQSNPPYPNTSAPADVEMQPLNGPAPNSKDPDHILNECSAIDRAVDELERQLDILRGKQRDFLADRARKEEVEFMGNDIMTGYRSLGDRLKRIKSSPESGNPRNKNQVGRVDRKLKKAINDYQNVEKDFRRDLTDQQARQYRIVRPDATDAEVREAVEDPNTQIFQQALLQSDRRGQAQSTLSAVRARHDAIQDIEKKFIELAQLFQDLDNIVVQQDAMVQNIEMKGEEVHDNVVKGNEEIGGAIVKARSARRKKWWCLLIVILILIAIAIIVAVVVEVVIKPGQNKTN